MKQTFWNKLNDLSEMQLIGYGFVMAFFAAFTILTFISALS